ncbi:Hypothetical protein RG1141_CH07150 [Neorhizobium galegae bv. officinalis bv. officinalis str. HAMBI 1141]|uniref:Uncharacterized protein n=1 Tax=Neorhizobium galegae bv. officinalis bv. officinalis str. HAMBI 1141 TaxID=1028801 RepID=A0A068T6V9_NEOGA|nr:DUF6766 family protein [Neorhizobium galegae]CDN53075.1 Hypothetical protein RG1141_CH07150 [Neorhizobium galegae bv. officinalis bv. officinalis str. HAMBI 1141]
MQQNSLWRAYSYAWITLAFFVFSLVGHWLFGWFAFVQEQAEHGQPVEFSPYLVEMLRDTFENWQSEFLQLLWQVGGLAFFLFLGSPQSKEGSDRLEAKIDVILRRVDPADGEGVIRELDERYSGRHTDEPEAHKT